MILGVGIDVVHVERIRRWRKIEGLYERFFHPEELASALPRGEVGILSLAARFAAKEAFFKALGTGWARGVTWLDVEVRRERKDPPAMLLYGEAERLSASKGVQTVHLSLSHTDHMAVATVILEG